MRSIEISTEVFAEIWSRRISGEEDENAILTRLLGVKNASESTLTQARSQDSIGKILWRQDVRQALKDLGGPAHLSQIYERVRAIRSQKGRTVPNNLEAIVRRELEYNSSDTNSYQGKRDWFRSVGENRSGIWALRDDCEP